VLKLVARFYDVEAGAISVDGIDVRAVDLEAHWRRTTALFQLPVSYYVPVAEAIAMSDPEGGQDPARIEAAARAAGIHERIQRLPKGYAAQLGKWFTDGQELSGGEWQRLAMARAFYRDAPIILLDEPTSMMDAWSEAAWFDRFRALAAERTAVLITHRFTIARRADLIYVMRGGEVVETGSHEELLALGGWYHESWEEQVASTPPAPAEGSPQGGEPLADVLAVPLTLAAEGPSGGAVAGVAPRLGGRP
jgi:ATP-binding cassette subfamily B protein